MARVIFVSYLVLPSFSHQFKFSTRFTVFVREVFTQQPEMSTLVWFYSFFFVILVILLSFQKKTIVSQEYVALFADIIWRSFFQFCLRNGVDTLHLVFTGFFTISLAIYGSGACPPRFYWISTQLPSFFCLSRKWGFRGSPSLVFFVCGIFLVFVYAQLIASTPLPNLFYDQKFFILTTWFNHPFSTCSGPVFALFLALNWICN